MAVPRERAGATLDVEAIRRDFPILARRFDGHPLVYLDNAASTQKPLAVMDAEREFNEQHYANAHRGIYRLAMEATEAYEGARGAVARFVGAGDARGVVFTRGTTEAINLVAHSWGRTFLRPGDEVLLTDMEHHANIVPWQMAARATGATVRYVPITDDGLLDMDAFAGLVTDRTRLIGVTGMSNVLGTIPPLPRIVEAARSVGALVLVDGAQVVPHLRFDFDGLGIDFLAFSGHKMLGPTASGGLVARVEHLEAMEPFMTGGEMISEVFHDRATWNEVPYKFEAGTMNISQEVALGAAIEYLEALGMDAVRAHEEAVTAYALERLSAVGARILGPMDASQRGGVVSFLHPEVHPHDLATILDADGVAIRAGHHCAQLIMRRFGVAATARASFYVYTTFDEIDALADSLDRAGSVMGF